MPVEFGPVSFDDSLMLSPSGLEFFTGSLKLDLKLGAGLGELPLGFLDTRPTFQFPLVAE